MLNDFDIMNQSQTNCYQISSHIIRKAQNNSIHLKEQHYVMYILIVTAKYCLLKFKCFNINQNEFEIMVIKLNKAKKQYYIRKNILKAWKNFLVAFIFNTNKISYRF